ncbi:MAG: gliding motility lipoprotein GldH [Prevotella sp.]|nr:gliding motility lipoprotein GldH [Prevotella sp.]
MTKRCLYIMTVAAVLLTACDRHMVYNHYKHVPMAGWERSDTLSFDVSPMADDGNYQQSLGISISSKFPFRDVTLVVDQSVHPLFRTLRDTIRCTLFDERGNIQGTGIGTYQYLFPLRTLRLHRGDSLHITVHHAMKREALPGIADVGIIMSRP